MADRVSCVGCGREILATTAARNHGQCRQCRPTEAASRARTAASRERLAAGGATSSRIGLMIFVVLCGVPALELNGFGFGIRLTFSTAILCSAIGGIVGGALICRRPLLAGAIGGAVAGPLGLIGEEKGSGVFVRHWGLILLRMEYATTSSKRHRRNRLSCAQPRSWEAESV